MENIHTFKTLVPETLNQPGSTRMKFANHILKRACEKGDVERIRKVLKQGANPNAQFKDGRTPLHLCMNIEAIPILVSYGANLNFADQLGNTPLHLACKDVNLDRMNQLLNHGANPNALNDSKYTPLHLLINCCTRCTNQDDVLDGIRLLVKFNAIIDIQDDEGQSPLLAATERVCNCNDNVKAELATKLVNQLLKLGANPNLETVYGTTPFSTAMCRKIDLMSMMVSYGAKIDYINAFGSTLLHKAASNLDVDLMTKLLEHGADPDVLDINTKQSAMHKVFIRSYKSFGDGYKNAISKAIKELIRHGANINAQDFCKGTPLHHAIGYCVEGIKMEVGLEILLRFRPDPYIRNVHGSSAFEKALEYNCMDATKVMLLQL